MEGIERITSKILEDAKAEVSRIESETEEFVREQQESSEKMRERVLADSRKNAEEDAKALIQRAESLASSECRKRDLSAKQDDVRRTIDLAVQQLVEAPAEVRLERYLSWIEARKIKEGVITLSAADQGLKDSLLKRLPTDKFTVADTPGKMRGGIIVSHGKMEENLTYDLVIHNYLPRLAQLAQNQLDATQGEEDTDE